MCRLIIKNHPMISNHSTIEIMIIKLIIKMISLVIEETINKINNNIVIKIATKIIETIKIIDMTIHKITIKDREPMVIGLKQTVLFN
jgi:hypothetical protein